MKKRKRTNENPSTVINFNLFCFDGISLLSLLPEDRRRAIK